MLTNVNAQNDKKTINKMIKMYMNFPVNEKSASPIAGGYERVARYFFFGAVSPAGSSISTTLKPLYSLPAARSSFSNVKHLPT